MSIFVVFYVETSSKPMEIHGRETLLSPSFHEETRGSDMFFLRSSPKGRRENTGTFSTPAKLLVGRFAPLPENSRENLALAPVLARLGLWWVAIFLEESPRPP